MENILLSKRWCRLWFHEMIQVTVHAIALYDGAVSILGSASVLRMPMKQSEVALLGLLAGDGGCAVAKESWS